MKDATPKAIYLKDYTVPPFTIDKIDLVFDLEESKTRVETKMSVLRHPKDNSGDSSLFLNGEELDFISAKINGNEWKEVEIQEEGLLLKNVPESFELEIVNSMNPKANTALDGLYQSGDIFCTQNEPEGFRRITYFLDRPDVMAKFTTKIIADKKNYPILLSNGNPVDQGDLDNGKHFVCWEDPFRKPCYLYALVAGDLGLVQDSYTTKSGREIDLRIYVDKGNEYKCGHAMESLKKSMKWDEDRFDLEYDLDIYMIVAVDSFNMGAMENKGLNVFNSAYVLADPKTATDSNFLGIESVIGHEYFHNWTGNRVTCRDWFQLTLKEGLTVFRDQEFSADMNAGPLKRIEDVDMLRSYQFVEDGGPTAHPIRPDQYMEINNFYTATVYEKGSEVIRMVHTFLGEEGFQKGMKLYFERFDGGAVTTEDFIKAMSDANDGFDFAQFSLWYSQAGTPELSVQFKREGNDLILNVKQKTPSTPGQSEKKSLHMPLVVGLVGSDGKDENEVVLHVKRDEEEFRIEGKSGKATPSINRGFKCPVRLKSNLTKEEMIFLMANDSDTFNRYEMAQEIYKSELGQIIAGEIDGPSDQLMNAWYEVLKDQTLDPSIKEYLLQVPKQQIMHQEQEVLKIDETHQAAKNMATAFATKYKDELLALYHSLDVTGEYQLDGLSIGKRALKARVLDFLCSAGGSDVEEIAKQAFLKAENMTDEISSFRAIVHSGHQFKDEAIQKFYEKWKHETLVMQKWLVVQATAPVENNLENVLKLENVDIYDKKVPNLVRSLVAAFTTNFVNFHKVDGSGYRFIVERMLELDKINPQMASRLATSFRPYAKLDDRRKALVKGLLENAIKSDLSKNTYEIISKTLKI